jgi:hypothetical protein
VRATGVEVRLLGLRGNELVNGVEDYSKSNLDNALPKIGGDRGNTKRYKSGSDDIESDVCGIRHFI